jgi:hypothetical protein
MRQKGVAAELRLSEPGGLWRYSVGAHRVGGTLATPFTAVSRELALPSLPLPSVRQGGYLPGHQLPQLMNLPAKRSPAQAGRRGGWGSQSSPIDGAGPPRPHWPPVDARALRAPADPAVFARPRAAVFLAQGV